MGDVLFRGASPTEIKAMPYHELMYWQGWHNVLAEKERSLNPNA